MSSDLVLTDQGLSTPFGPRCSTPVSGYLCSPICWAWDDSSSEIDGCILSNVALSQRRIIWEIIQKSNVESFWGNPWHSLYRVAENRPIGSESDLELHIEYPLFDSSNPLSLWTVLLCQFWTFRQTTWCLRGLPESLDLPHSCWQTILKLTCGACGTNPWTLERGLQYKSVNIRAGEGLGLTRLVRSKQRKPEPGYLLGNLLHFKVTPEPWTLNPEPKFRACSL